MSTPSIPVVVRDGIKTFTVLENNPEVMTTLAHKLGTNLAIQFRFDTTNRLSDMKPKVYPKP